MTKFLAEPMSCAIHKAVRTPLDLTPSSIDRWRSAYRKKTRRTICSEYVVDETFR